MNRDASLMVVRWTEIPIALWTTVPSTNWIGVPSDQWIGVPSTHRTLVPIDWGITNSWARMIRFTLTASTGDWLARDPCSHLLMAGTLMFMHVWKKLEILFEIWWLSSRQKSQQVKKDSYKYQWIGSLMIWFGEIYWKPNPATPMLAVSKDILVLIRYWARAICSIDPLIVITRSWWVPSSVVSSNLDIVISAPVSCLISAIFVPPLPITQPISSLGTVSSCSCVPPKTSWGAAARNWWLAAAWWWAGLFRAAKAVIAPFMWSHC